MQADGALEKKLEAYVKVNELYAAAIGQYKGNWVPTVQQGASSGSQNGAVDLLNLLSVKAAKDLALDLSLPAANAQAPAQPAQQAQPAAPAQPAQQAQPAAPAQPAQAPLLWHVS
jgi:hypothetical protein